MGLYLGNSKISNLGETFTPREIQSVNEKTAVEGKITVYGSDTQVSETDTRKISEALSSVPSNVVSKIIAGDNITISPSSGIGEVTISASGGGGSGGGTTTNALTLKDASDNVVDTFNGSVAKTLKAGSNITFTKSGDVTTIASSGGGGGGSSNGYNLMARCWDGHPASTSGAVEVSFNGITIHGFNRYWPGDTEESSNPSAAIRFLYNGKVGNSMLCKVFSCVTSITFTIEQGYGSSLVLTDSDGTHTFTTDGSYTLVSDTIITAYDITCLMKGTKIATTEGEKNIEDINIGDNIKCLDENGELTTDIVTYCDSSEEKYGDIRDDWTLADGTVISTVHPHEFYNVTKNRFMYIADFEIGDLFRKLDGTTSALVKHDEIHEKTRHFTLFTKRYNTYFANKILTGNRYSVKFKRGMK